VAASYPAIRQRMAAQQHAHWAGPQGVAAQQGRHFSIDVECVATGTGAQGTARACVRARITGQVNIASRLSFVARFSSQGTTSGVMHCSRPVSTANLGSFQPPPPTARFPCRPQLAFCRANLTS
jgi:hypothetical protein